MYPDSIFCITLMMNMRKQVTNEEETVKKLPPKKLYILFDKKSVWTPNMLIFLAHIWLAPHLDVEKFIRLVTYGRGELF